MYKWTGDFRCASLPKVAEEDLRRRTANILDRHGLGDRLDIVQDVVDEVSLALAGSNHKLRRNGRGRPVDGPEKLLAVLIADVLMKHGIRGNWVGLGDQEEDGEMGIVAELESIAQSALRKARGEWPAPGSEDTRLRC
jgi:hypothetical protein